MDGSHSFSSSHHLLESLSQFMLHNYITKYLSTDFV